MDSALFESPQNPEISGSSILPEIMPGSYEVESGSQNPEAVAEVDMTDEREVKMQGPKHDPRSTSGDK